MLDLDLAQHPAQRAAQGLVAAGRNTELDSGGAAIYLTGHTGWTDPMTRMMLA